MRILVTLLLFYAVTVRAAPLAPFEAVDLDGKAVKLATFTGVRAVVLVSHQVACGVLRRQAPEIERVAKAYAEKGVRFFFVNGSIQDDAASIRKERDAYGLKIPILIDKGQAILRDAGFKVTAEILVIDAKTRERIYQGPVNDRVEVEGVKAKGTPYLRDALDDFLAGRPVKEANRRAFGCSITFKKGNGSP